MKNLILGFVAAFLLTTSAVAGSRECVAIAQTGDIFVYVQEADGEVIDLPNVEAPAFFVEVATLSHVARVCAAVASNGKPFVYAQTTHGETIDLDIF